MTSIKTLLIGAATVAMLGASPAMASDIYMTDSNNPWWNASNDGAMDLAFGAGSWTKQAGFTASVLTAANRFVYVDGGGNASTGFNAFLVNNAAAVADYVNGGGRIMINAGRWDNSPLTLDMGFGQSLTGQRYSNSASLTAEGLAAGLDANGAGNGWTGSSFGHDITSGGTCYVMGSAGCVFSGGQAGAGAMFVGGQTNPDFHSNGARQLRANELRFVATQFATAGAGVPEPAAWALMIGGFGMVGGALRRRSTAVRFATA